MNEPCPINCVLRYETRPINCVLRYEPCPIIVYCLNEPCPINCVLRYEPQGRSRPRRQGRGRPSFRPSWDSPTRTEPNTIHMIKWGQTQGWKQGNTNASSGGHATRALSRGERRGNRPQGFTWFAQVPVLKGATPGPQGRRRGGGRPPAGRASPGGQKRSQVSGFATRYLLPQTLL